MNSDEIVDVLAVIPLEDYERYRSDVWGEHPGREFNEEHRQSHIVNPVLPSLRLRQKHYVKTNQWVTTYVQRQGSRHPSLRSRLFNNVYVSGTVYTVIGGLILWLIVSKI